MIVLNKSKPHFSEPCLQRRLNYPPVAEGEELRWERSRGWLYCNCGRERGTKLVLVVLPLPHCICKAGLHDRIHTAKCIQLCWRCLKYREGPNSKCFSRILKAWWVLKVDVGKRHAFKIYWNSVGGWLGQRNPKLMLYWILVLNSRLQHLEQYTSELIKGIEDINLFTCPQHFCSCR